MNLQLHWSGQTDRGRVRANNEDAFLALSFDAHQVQYLGKVGEGSLEAMDYVFAVSDGMGGAMAGEFASKITVEKVTRLLPRGFRNRAAGLDAGFADLFGELFGEIHKALSVLGSTYPECAGMGATLSLCWFTPGWMFFGHLGDSRVYYLPAAGGMKQLTHDHTQVGWMVRQGKMSEREARAHPLRNSLLRALGAGHQFVDPQVGAVGIEPGDRFLLCTDGLTDGLWDKQLLQLLTEPTAAEAAQLPSRRLVEASLERSGKDNTTALVVEVETVV
jgi:protein phosphatase